MGSSNRTNACYCPLGSTRSHLLLALLSTKGAAKQMINLYVDDLRDIPEGFVGARTCQDAIIMLKTYPIDILSLDHDLGEDEQGNLLPTGDDLVNWVIEHGATRSKLIINKIYLHTDNPVGRDRMYKALIRAQERGFIHKKTKIYHYSITNNTYTDHKEGS